MKYMVLAGEASGDLHGSYLIKALRDRDINAEFVFMGGDMMTEAADTQPLVHINEMAYMGFSEVLRHLPVITRNLRLIKSELQSRKPDALILIDYPSFNLKVAKYAKRLGIKVFYYISPKIWAWKEYRAKSIKKLVDKMFVIFPFEVEYYRNRHAYEADYVGNPTVAEIDEAMAKMPERNDFLSRNKLRDRPIIALLPGSRRGEIQANLTVMNAVVERYPQYRGVIAGAPGIPEDFYRRFSSLPVVYSQTYALLKNSVGALVTSGTATLETALIGTPQVACYRSNGSKIAYNIMKKILKVSYVTLPNLIADRDIIPELLLHNCNVDNVDARLNALITDNRVREDMLEGYREIRRRLTADLEEAPAENAAQKIISVLTGK